MGIDKWISLLERVRENTNKLYENIPETVDTKKQIQMKTDLSTVLYRLDKILSTES